MIEVPPCQDGCGHRWVQIRAETTGAGEVFDLDACSRPGCFMLHLIRRVGSNPARRVEEYRRASEVIATSEKGRARR